MNDPNPHETPCHKPQIVLNKFLITQMIVHKRISCHQESLENLVIFLIISEEENKDNDFYNFDVFNTNEDSITI